MVWSNAWAGACRLCHPGMGKGKRMQQEVANSKARHRDSRSCCWVGRLYKEAIKWEQAFTKFPATQWKAVSAVNTVYHVQLPRVNLRRDRRGRCTPSPDFTSSTQLYRLP